MRRATKTLRHYCKEHQLFFMWTLTYRGGEADLAKVRRHVEGLMAKVVRERGGQPFPYAYVVELHADGERLHIHMAVPFWFHHKRLTVLWGRGFVWCTDKRRRGEARVCGAVRAASYLAKYVGKTFEHAAFGRHRYEVARGWKVTSFQIVVGDLDVGQRYAEAVFMGEPEHIWDSRDCKDWKGPATRVLFFMPRSRDG